MRSGTLYLSFWHICLENLPETAFVHRRITPAVATRRIERARGEGRLLCVSQDDLLAPYRQPERDRHEALCKVLKRHFGIGLTLRDFVTNYKDGPDTRFVINPLNCFQIRTMVTFHVVECVPRKTAMKKARK